MRTILERHRSFLRVESLRGHGGLGLARSGLFSLQYLLAELRGTNVKREAHQTVNAHAAGWGHFSFLLHFVCENTSL